MSANRWLVLVGIGLTFSGGFNEAFHGEAGFIAFLIWIGVCLLVGAICSAIKEGNQ